MLRQLRQLAQYRWCPGAVIPPETRVDLSRFPEDEFPVSCPQCEYELRGLVDNCCPECGRPFDRGRLLVEQYLLLRDIPLTAIGKLARTGAVIGWSVLVVAGICFGLALARIDPLAINPSRFFPPFLFAFATAGALTVTCSIIWGRQQERRRADRKEQGRRVLEALDWTDRRLARAQKLRIIPGVLGVLFLVVAFASEDGNIKWAFPILLAGIYCVDVLFGRGSSRNKAG